MALHLEAQPQPDSQGLVQLFLFEAWGLEAPEPELSIVDRASRRAVACFWALLADLSSVGLLPRAGESVLLLGHAFLVCVEGPVGVGDRLELVPPSADHGA